MKLKILITLLFIIITGCLSDIYAGEFRNLAVFYRKKGLFAQRQGDLDKALSYFSKAREYDPSWPVIYNDLGIIYEAKFMLNEAEVMYLKALEYDVNFASVYTNLALLYEKKVDYPRAALYFKKRIKLGPPDDYWVQLAQSHLRKLESTSYQIPNLPRVNSRDISSTRERISATGSL